MVGQHHPLNGYESEQTPGDRERQGSLVCYNPWGHIELDTTQQLNNNNIGEKYLKMKFRESSYNNIKNNLVIKLIKDVYNLYTETYKMLLREILTI